MLENCAVFVNLGSMLCVCKRGRISKPNTQINTTFLLKFPKVVLLNRVPEILTRNQLLNIFQFQSQFALHRSYTG